MIENLLVEIGEAHDWNSRGQYLDTSPSVRTGILCLIYNDQGKTVSHEIPDEYGSVEKIRCHGCKEVENEFALFVEQAAALGFPFGPFLTVTCCPIRESPLVLRQQNPEDCGSPKKISMRSQ
ncbi:MAG TPA: hypothetical protein VHF01_04850 [Candidatus Acidoferrum sp.]|nr:hypothetical protein [Candidatus Acidoferrum sp.]